MKTNIILILIGVIFLSGCSGVPYSSGDKKAFALMVGSCAADYHSTMRVLNDGGVERNPFIGDNPSNGGVALFQVANVGIAYLLGEVWPEHRKEIFTVGAVVHGGAAIHNYSE